MPCIDDTTDVFSYEVPSDDESLADFIIRYGVPRSPEQHRDKWREIVGHHRMIWISCAIQLLALEALNPWAVCYAIEET